MRKGQTVFYSTMSKIVTFRATVLRVHRDGSVTIRTEFALDPKTGEDQHGYFGCKYRTNPDLLREVA